MGLRADPELNEHDWWLHGKDIGDLVREHSVERRRQATWTERCQQGSASWAHNRRVFIDAVRTGKQ